MEYSNKTCKLEGYCLLSQPGAHIFPSFILHRFYSSFLIYSGLGVEALSWGLWLGFSGSDF